MSVNTTVKNIADLSPCFTGHRFPWAKEEKYHSKVRVSHSIEGSCNYNSEGFVDI